MIKKRTKEEISISEQNGDYAGGYNFINWLIFMRASWFAPLLFAIGIDIAAIYYGVQIVYICVSAIIFVVFFLQLNDYKILKKSKPKNKKI